MLINDFLKKIEKNSFIYFLSLNSNFDNIGFDNINYEEIELTSDEFKENLNYLYKNIEPLYSYNNSISTRPKKDDVLIGLVISNIVDVKDFIKKYK
jgi:hypothetical protein